MIDKKNWNEFRDAGLLWFTNRFLHLFGWAIVIDYEDLTKGTIKEVYPARCKFRGFDDKSESKGFINVTKYLKDNINDLLKEAQE
ncbi:MAG: hypothetical protein M0R03_13090 [Novosphingobium sp.]|nr:hypothetical protein [Novosphingobium sp.]